MRTSGQPSGSGELAGSAGPPGTGEPSGGASGGVGPVDLFPGGVLEKAAGAGKNLSDRPSAETPAQKADRWAREAAAEARTRSGNVDHEWRVVERELTLGFNPSVGAVHEVPDRLGARVADRLRSLLLQGVAASLRGPPSHPNLPGSHIDVPASQSIDPSQQGFVGAGEGANLRALPLQQQQAGLEALSEPSSWIGVEVEVTTGENGEVLDARVVMPSGRRALDRQAVAAVRDAVAHAHVKAAVSRWLLEAGYQVAPPTSLGFTFDENSLFDHKAPTVGGKYPFKAEVVTRVSLCWVMPIP